MFHLAIKSNNVVTPGSVKRGAVIITNGIITGVVDVLPENIGGIVIDAGDSVLMPGVIDPHVHINEPGRTDWEGFETATRSSIAGGVTTVADMPLNSSPVTTTLYAYEKKLAAARNQLHANCGFWGGVVPGNEKEIEALIEHGVLGFKAFLAHSGIPDFPNADEGDLRKVMPLLAKHNLPLLVHCELTNGHADWQQNNVRSYKTYLASRPPHWEDNAIAMMIRLCEEYGCHVHIVHLSSASSTSQIGHAKEKGLPLTAETAQHYLYFNAEDIPDGQTQFKCAPPIREKLNNQLLWDALDTGIVDFVATDHSPCPPQMKHQETGDFSKAWGGIASLQFALPVLWTVAKRNGGSITGISNWLSENPSKLIGRSKSKGRIAPGYDADLVIFNADKKFIVKEEMIFHKHKVTPYLHHELYGVIEQTFLKGVRVYDSGEFTEAHKGEIIIRSNE